MNVENVVYPPTNPTGDRQAKRVGDDHALRDHRQSQPRNRLPVTLIKNVPTGKLVPNTRPQTVDTINRSTEPAPPATPTARYRNKNCMAAPTDKKAILCADPPFLAAAAGL